jgi:hypothetical protein
MAPTNAFFDSGFMRSNESIPLPSDLIPSRSLHTNPGSTFRHIGALSLACAALALAAAVSPAQQQDPMASMPGMKMGDKKGQDDMKDMGPSMAAMAGHMYMTSLRPKQPGDEEKARAVVAQVKASIERYKDYKKALADGYTIGNPEVNEPQFHFISQANTAEAEKHFDPTRPSALLYFQTPKQRYKLEGVMFTVPPNAGEDELDDRIPLSIVRWHKHIKFCAAPADKVKEYLGKHPKFGMFGSINTPEACKAEGGTFFPVIFTWMVHVFPYETDLKDIFSVNDDIPHFGTEYP